MLISRATGASGEDLLRAIVVGYEISTRIGVAVQPSHSDDFRNTQEPNGLDTDSYSLTNFDDDLMAIR